MPGCHRNDDSRYCGAATIVTHQTKVRVNNQLWAVNGDLDTHKTGPLIAVYPTLTVRIENILIICAPGDHAGDEPYPPFHAAPATWPSTASTDTWVYAGASGGG